MRLYIGRRGHPGQPRRRAGESPQPHVESV